MDDKTKSFITTFGAAALIGLVLVAPFAFLELRYNSTQTPSFSHLPFPLFGFLWLLPTAFIITAAPIVRAIRSDGGLLAHPVTLSLRVVFLAMIAVMWVGIVQDQMPCFLGVPNCD